MILLLIASKQRCHNFNFKKTKTKNNRYELLISVMKWKGSIGDADFFKKSENKL